MNQATQPDSAPRGRSGSRAASRPSGQTPPWKILVAVLIVLGGWATWQAPAFFKRMMIQRFEQTVLDHRLDEAGEMAEEMDALFSAHPDYLMPRIRLARLQDRLDEANELLQRARNAGIRAGMLADEEHLNAARGGFLERSAGHLPRLLSSSDHDDRDVAEAFAIGLRLNFRFEEAALLLENWKQAYPTDQRPWKHLGLMYEMSTAWSEALEAYRKAVALGDASVETNYHLGVCLQETDQSQAAQDVFEACLARDPEHREARLQLAGLLKNSDDPVEAEPHYRHLWEAEPPDLEAGAGLGQTLQLAGRPKEAAAVLEKVLEAWPEHAVSLFTYATCLRATGDVQTADEVLEQWKAADKAVREMELMVSDLQKDPTNTELRCRIGVLVMRHYSRRMGLQYLLAVLQADPENQQMHEALANYYRSRGDTERFDFHRRHLQAETLP